jgi:zinc transport system substrate-binding protein
VNTSAGFSDAYIEIETATTHSHGPGGDHSHAGTAFTTWLDLTQATEQARAIKNALMKRRPDQAEVFEQNFNLLAQELRELDTELRAVLKDVDVPLLASHPVYQYLARAYGLDLRSVTWEPGEVPPGGEWVALQTLLNEHPARVMLWEDSPIPETARRLQTLGIDVVVFSPAGNRPEAGDFMTVMQENLQRLEAAISAP